MGTFFIGPENFESLTPKGQAQLTEKINTAIKEGLMISPRGEHLDGFGNVVISITVMTPEEYERYNENGGSWEFISGVDWVCQRLLYEGVLDSASPGEGRVA